MHRPVFLVLFDFTCYPEMFGEWCIDGRVDGVFLLTVGVLNEFLKDVARDEGEEWVTAEMCGRRIEKSRFFVSVHLRACKTLNVIANDIQNQNSCTELEVEREPGPELEPEHEREAAVLLEVDPGQCKANNSLIRCPCQSFTASPVDIGLLNLAMNTIHRQSRPLRSSKSGLNRS